METPFPNASQSGTWLLGGDLPIHRLGFGTLQFTGDGGFGPPPDIKEAKDILCRAYELGVNFIDTADSYGPFVAENLIAEALYPYPKDLVIATKGGFIRHGPGIWIESGRPEYLKTCVEGSLKRLRLDCIDLYQLHVIDPLVPIDESVGALKELQQQGKIRHIGLSNVEMEDIKIASRVAKIVSIQNEYNIAFRRSEDVLRYCEKNNIAFIPWFPLGNGELASMSGPLGKFAQKQGAAPPELALAWLLHHSKVMLPIPGTSSLAHLEEDIKAASIVLSEKDISEMEQQVQKKMGFLG